MPPAETVVAQVAAKLRALVLQGRVDPASAISLVRAVGDACKQMGVSRSEAGDVIEAVVVELAKGRDGALGTADDLVSPATLDTLRMLCDHQLVHDLAAWAAEAQRRLLPRLLPCLLRLLRLV